jgi:hypothetical protein
MRTAPPWWRPRRAVQQLQLAAVHRPRQRHDGRLALAHDAQLPQRFAGRLRQHGGEGKQPCEFRPGRGDGLAKALHQPLPQRACGRHGDLLAQHGAHGQLKPIQSAGHAQAIAVGKTGVQHGIDGRRVGVQVEHGAHAAHHQWQHGVQAVAGLQQHLVAVGVKVGIQPAAMVLQPAST